MMIRYILKWGKRLFELLCAKFQVYLYFFSASKLQSMKSFHVFISFIAIMGRLYWIYKHLVLKSHSFRYAPNFAIQANTVSSFLSLFLAFYRLNRWNLVGMCIKALKQPINQLYSTQMTVYFSSKRFASKLIKVNEIIWCDCNNSLHNDLSQPVNLGNENELAQFRVK